MPATGTTKLAANADSSSGVGATAADPVELRAAFAVDRAESSGGTPMPVLVRSARPVDAALPFDACPFNATPFAGGLEPRGIESRTAPFK